MKQGAYRYLRNQVQFEIEPFTAELNYTIEGFEALSLGMTGISHFVYQRKTLYTPIQMDSIIFH